MDNRSDYPAEPRNLGCELFRVFSQPERNGFATGTLISPSQARRNSSRAWRVGRTEGSPDERELGRRSALRGNGRPKGQPFSASSIKSQACRHNGDTPPGRARLRLRALPVSRAAEEITGADPGLEQLAHEMRGPRLLGTDANCGAAQVGEASERAVTPSKQDQRFSFRQSAEDFDTRVRGHRGAVLHDRERIGAAPAVLR